MTKEKIKEVDKVMRKVNKKLSIEERMMLVYRINEIEALAIKKAKQEEAKEWISDLKQTILNKHTIRLLKKKHNTK